MDYFPTTIKIDPNYYQFNYDNYYYIYNLDKSTKIKISLSICDAIEELHKNNIVHCDLKLENMIYDAKENLIYLIDFGCSCNLKNENLTLILMKIWEHWVICHPISLMVISQKRRYLFIRCLIIRIMGRRNLERR